jgi:hypothetical protein
MSAMASRPARPLAACAAVVMLVALAGCGSGSHPATTATARAPRRSCPETVLETLAKVVHRIYHEGVASERTVVAQRTIATSAPLRAAVEAGDPAAATAAARALVAAGRMTNLTVVKNGRVLAHVGGAAVAPLSGQLTSAAKTPLATYLASVWSDEGLLAESEGMAEAHIAIRAHDRSVGGSFRLPPGPLPAQGRIVLHGVPYQYASVGATAYPAGPARVYVVRPLHSTASLCGAGSEQTEVNTLTRIARRIYEAEGGSRTRPQVVRVQHEPALLAAVAAHDRPAAVRAIEGLLNQHIVRLRVRTRAGLLADVGGPWVLAPVSAPLRAGGHEIGSFTLSIQDDEGYMRLARRLAGLRVLMYQGPPSHGTLVKNSLGPDPGTVPAAGRYTYRGSDYRVYTLAARAFPSGPLTIRVLIPIPYV